MQKIKVKAGGKRLDYPIFFPENFEDLGQKLLEIINGRNFLSSFGRKYGAEIRFFSVGKVQKLSRNKRKNTRAAAGRVAEKLADGGKNFGKSLCRKT